MKNPNLSKLIILGIISTGIALAGLPLIIQSFSKFYMKFIYIGGAISAAGIIFGIIFVRCPYCGKALSIKGFVIKYCPHCGEKLKINKAYK